MQPGKRMIDLQRRSLGFGISDVEGGLMKGCGLRRGLLARIAQQIGIQEGNWVETSRSLSGWC